jgi:hypothetical protein
VLVVCHHSRRVSGRSRNGLDQTVLQYRAVCRLSATDPTSSLSADLSKRSEVFVSSLTLLLNALRVVCCVDRLNPQPEGDVVPSDRSICGIDSLDRHSIQEEHCANCYYVGCGTLHFARFFGE